MQIRQTKCKPIECGFCVTDSISRMIESDHKIHSAAFVCFLGHFPRHPISINRIWFYKHHWNCILSAELDTYSVETGCRPREKCSEIKLLVATRLVCDCDKIFLYRWTPKIRRKWKPSKINTPTCFTKGKETNECLCIGFARFLFHWRWSLFESRTKYCVHRLFRPCLPSTCDYFCAHLVGGIFVRKLFAYKSQFVHSSLKSRCRLPNKIVRRTLPLSMHSAATLYIGYNVYRLHCIGQLSSYVMRLVIRF